jgi:predicted GNAT superfamily acetyltransferase
LRPFEAGWLAAALALNNAHQPAVSRVEAADLAWYGEHAERFVVAVDPALDALAALVITIGPDSAYPSANYAWFSGRHASGSPSPSPLSARSSPSPSSSSSYSSASSFSSSSSSSSASSCFSYVDRVVIGERWQRIGLGRRLYEDVVIAGARAAGRRAVCAEVNLRPRNDASLGFHAALGFVEVGRRTDAEGKLLSMVERPLD